MNSLNEGRHFVPKGWGFEDWIVNNDRYCGKVLFVKKGRKCSWHYHLLKDETFYLQSGELLLRYISHDDLKVALNTYPARLYCWDEKRILQGLGSENYFGEIVLRPGDSFHVPVGMRHQFEGVLDSTLIEFSTHHEDSDSYRVIKGD